ncbi:MAG: NADPH-dependent glutamate synthase [Theionarchaea archaeon]|nr:NADPH-dependent glutamate synthase [Theionarchaea archaeon]
MPAPSKTKIPMPKQDPSDRGKNFDEVALGYSAEQAIAEANRCLKCKNPKCIAGCPVEIDIPAFIGSVSEGNFREAIVKVKDKNVLPAICGRVCPQETQCEEVCVLGRRREPVAIGRLERFVADWEAEMDEVCIPDCAPPTGKKVAVVGSGPAGLTAAGDLARFGHEVTIFEALHKPGGVLVYGIPEFRLPKAIVEREIDTLKCLGVKVRTDFIVGRTGSIDDLLGKGYDAVFVGTGAGLPKFLGIPGENLSGVFSANEFLTRTNLMKAYRFPEYDTPIKVGKRVAVIGGGNVTMDSARSALRYGADVVTVVYRRSRAEMPARIEEVENAEEEGIKFEFLSAPVGFLGDDRGVLTGMECIRMELGEPDESGRRRPVPIPDSNFVLDIDTVIIAIGQGAHPLISATTKDLKVNKWGYILTDPDTGKTSKEGVFAGGDIVTGEATVIAAMGAGRKAATAIHEFLCSG